jgi:hypothetical protein
MQTAWVINFPRSLNSDQNKINIGNFILKRLFILQEVQINALAWLRIRIEGLMSRQGCTSFVNTINNRYRASIGSELLGQ